MSDAKSRWAVMTAVSIIILVSVRMVYGTISLEMAPLYHLYLPLLLTISAALILYFAVRNRSCLQQQGASQKHIKSCSPDIIRCHPLLFDHWPDGIMVLDSEGRLCSQNLQAKLLFELSDDTLVNEDLFAKTFSIPRSNLSEVQAHLLKYKTWCTELKHCINNEERFYRHRVDLIETVPVFCVITSVDITFNESVCANLSQFLTNISHEIKTPMIGILGSVDLLEQSVLQQNQLEHLHIIRECSEQLLTVFDKILDLYKIEVGMVDINPTCCHIRPLLTRALTTVEPLLQAKGLQVQLEVDEGLPEIILIDQDKMQQILTNVLYNAAKYTHQGSIMVKAVHSRTPDKEHLLVSIKDTGIGIAPQELPHIFAPFKQVDSSNTREYGGIGLGLYICRKLLNLMNGSIWAESLLGTGTTIYIEIPLHDGSPESHHGRMAPDLASAADNACLSFEPARILLVEDNLLNQKIVFQMLHNYGFYCRVVGNGLECLTVLQQEPFDVVLLDMQMPVMDGYETAGLIRQDAHLKNLAVIAITAHSMVGDREKCIASGCTDYIAKPFKARELAEIITRHLPLNDKEIPPQIDALLINELMPDLLEMLSEMIESLHIAWRKKDLAQIQSLGHDIKGTAGMYGLISISELACQLETAAREHDYQNIAVLMQDVKDQYNQSRVQFLDKTSACL